MTGIRAVLAVALVYFESVSAQHNVWDIELEDGGSMANASLLSLEDDTLTILCDDESSKLWIESIKRISKGGRKSNVAANIITGTLIGGGAGFTLGAVMDVRENPLRHYSGDNNTKMYTAIAGGVLGLTIASIAAFDRKGVIQSMELGQMGFEEKRSAFSALLTGPVAPTRFSYGFRPGVAIPAGDFGKTSGGDNPGAAMLGFCLDGEFNYVLDDEVSWTLSLLLTLNNVDEAAVGDSVRKVFFGRRTDVDSWFCMWSMTGLQIRRAVTSDFSPYIDVQIGILLGSSPKLTLSSNGSNDLNVLSSTATGFAFGIGGGFMLKGGFKFHAQYLHSEPEYTLTTTDGGWSQSRRQPTGLIQITAGWML